MNPETNKIHLGDCLQVMAAWPENFIDTIITDPPYGLSFMGKDWDHGIPGPHFWAEALRIAKPGAFLLAFGGTRTYHRLAVAIEDAGWQIRDCLMWLYGSGFPKSHNLHGEFEGWGTALKPAWEPIIMAMKPIDGTFAENAEKWDVAGLNVDGARIPTYAPSFEDTRTDKIQQNAYGKYGTADYDGTKGRWPANLILDEEAAGMLDAKNSGLRARGNITPKDNGAHYNASSYQFGGLENGFGGDSGGASRFFYVAKSASAERNEGMEGMECGVGALRDSGRGKIAANHHPTVKPLDLMKYLVNLTRTPQGGIILDPFCGSGTTLWAAEYHNRPWMGIEMNPEYVAIANARIARERAQIKMAI